MPDSTSQEQERARAVVQEVFGCPEHHAASQIEPFVSWRNAIAAALAEQRKQTIHECADYVRKCGTAPHPNGYGDWVGGEVDPIKLLTGIADVLDHRAADQRGTA
jgi:hypothetical protein